MGTPNKAATPDTAQLVEISKSAGVTRAVKHWRKTQQRKDHRTQMGYTRAVTKARSGIGVAIRREAISRGIDSGPKVVKAVVSLLGGLK